MTTPSLLPDAGSRVGSYELVRLLGEGSMGRVFEARHLKLDRAVAIKLLRPERARDQESVQRFFQEARTVNRITHPHIVQIQDFVEDVDADGRPQAYCVMEYAPGTTLAALLRTGPLSIDRITALMGQVCAALEAAHQLGVIHRDVKPENVLVTRGPDGGEVAKVLDFGVAKLLQPDPEVALGSTFEGAIVGTPKYMAPEQAASLEVDSRTDVYGVGCVLYELLCGHPPFDGDSFGPLMAQILTQPPDPLPDQTPAGEVIPPGLRRLVDSCLKKDASRRPAGMAEVRAALAKPVSRPVQSSAWRSAAALIPFAAVVTAAVALGLGAPAADAKLQHLGAEPSVAASPDVSRETLPAVSIGESVGLPPADSRVASPPPMVEPAAASAPVKNASLQPRSSGTWREKTPSASKRSSRDAVLNPFAQ